MTPLAQRLEALLFVAGEAVPIPELKKILKVSGEEFSEILTELLQQIKNQGLTCLVTEQDIELTTSPEVSAWLSQTANQESAELSRAAAETLAVIAYRGPVTRYEIDTIRGVDCRPMLRKLLRQGIIQRLPTRGRAPQYDVTGEFFKHLGVVRRDNLPAYQELTTNPALLSFLHPST